MRAALPDQEGSAGLAGQTEEAKRLLEAIQAFGAIDDDAACAKAVSEVLEQWPDYHAQLRVLRQQRVQRLKNKGGTWKEIGAVLGGITPSRAQQIGAGLRGAKRPKRGEASGE